MEYSIQNEQLSIKISSKGAELQSIIDKKNNYEYLWQGDPQFWTGRAPILFPIVGGLKNKEYLLDGIKYSMPNHGIIRINEGICDQISSKEVSVVLKSTEKTKKMYPFDFVMKVNYLLEERTLTINHTITNISSKDMPFVFGLHPAFNLDDTWENTSVELEDERLISTISTEEGWIIPKTTDYGIHRLTFNQDSFANDDTIIFENLCSRKAKLCFKNSSRWVQMDWTNDLPLLAFWSKANASYLCIEPWCGWADEKNNTTNELLLKKGMIILKPNTSKEIVYSITFG